MKLQLITYTQCNTIRLDPSADHYIFIVSKWVIQTWTSAGSLDLHIISKITEYAIGYEFIQQLKDNWKQASFFVWPSYSSVLKSYCDTNKIDQITLMEHNEPYLQRHLVQVLQDVWINHTITPNTQFFIDHQTFTEKFPKPPIMETFYRRMRKETWVLMEWDSPIWWERNYDKQNRKFDRKFKDVDHLVIEATSWRTQATLHYKKELASWWHVLPTHIPTTQSQAQDLLQFFIEKLLDRFGELEDAMYDTSDLVYHSMVSIAMNFWLLTPQEVVQAVAQADSAINNKEWFVRQVLWRREYMYHWFMHYQDSIYDQNVLWNTLALPTYFWKPEKSPHQMHCINHVLSKVDEIWYSHHIERLMIVGNFTLLMGYNPHHVNKWFWEQYTDAFERVVTPNVLGMSQYADGGNLATKPYVSSANYINKMSNYCKTCFYDPKEKYGEKACPMNFLYRNFVDENQELFRKRWQGFMLKHLEKVNIQQIQEQVRSFRSLPTTPYASK